MHLLSSHWPEKSCHELVSPFHFNKPILRHCGFLVKYFWSTYSLIDRLFHLLQSIYMIRNLNIQLEEKDKYHMVLNLCGCGVATAYLKHDLSSTGTEPGLQ